ncbi:MerR family transcriptional regulator [Roseateles oligotrophus]|uniref:MerR family transcriptional regulator n=1 Tax=Roseateles oligotrophus TaxID=1769250 RepID=A0ABT2YF88_9BURK|nr:MerR family transcriptional regulator [Roseateles oligotrophus]MCV2368683.1 MerR family transcriptional regulator [Roseateles oligotrophus]
MENSLPAIPAKRYFTIGEVSDLCGVKPYVLRYWEQEFTQLKPMKRRGNRRYYQHHEVLLIRRIRGLLYDQGFTISGARNQLVDGSSGPRASEQNTDEAEESILFDASIEDEDIGLNDLELRAPVASDLTPLSLDQVRAELLSIRETLFA